MRQIVARALSSVLGQNILALYGAHFANYLLPVVTVAFLARVLGPAAWGLLVVIQAFGRILSMLVEYGFNLSSTREVARSRDDATELSKILAGVMGAKFLLSIAVTTIALISMQFVALFRENSVLFLVGVAWAIAHGFNSLWFFRGLERMKLVAVLDVTVKTVGTLALFVVIRTPDDVWKVLALQAVASLVTTVCALVLAYRKVPFVPPSLRLVIQSLRRGWSLFIFQVVGVFSVSGNALILGLLATPQTVAFYTAGEKFVSMIAGLLTPVHQALFPRMSSLVEKSRIEAKSLAATVLKVSLASTVAAAVVSFWFAPIIVRVVLGPGYEPAVTVLRVLTILLPFNAVAHTLGTQWMLPRGLDWQYSLVVLFGGLVTVGLAVVLVPHFSHVGMAIAVVVAQALVALGIVVVLQGKRVVGRRTLLGEAGTPLAKHSKSIPERRSE